MRFPRIRRARTRYIRFITAGERGVRARARERAEKRKRSESENRRREPGDPMSQTRRPNVPTFEYLYARRPLSREY